MKANTLQKMSFCYSLILFGCVFMMGCVSNVRLDEIVEENLTSTHKSKSTVAVQALGKEGDEPTGDALTFLGTSGVDTMVFEEAIKNFLSKSGRFASIVSVSEADYLLTVTLLYVTHSGGHGMYGTASAHWRLSFVKDDSTVYDDIITTTSRATIWDAFIGTTRIQIVIEGAVRNNITEGLQALDKLDLKGDF